MSSKLFQVQIQMRCGQQGRGCSVLAGTASLWAPPRSPLILLACTKAQIRASGAISRHTPGTQYHSTLQDMPTLSYDTLGIAPFVTNSSHVPILCVLLYVFYLWNLLLWSRAISSVIPRQRAGSNIVGVVPVGPRPTCTWGTNLPIIRGSAASTVSCQHLALFVLDGRLNIVQEQWTKGTLVPNEVVTSCPVHPSLVPGLQFNRLTIVYAEVTK